MAAKDAKKKTSAAGTSKLVEALKRLIASQPTGPNLSNQQALSAAGLNGQAGGPMPSNGLAEQQGGHLVGSGLAEQQSGHLMGMDTGEKMGTPSLGDITTRLGKHTLMGAKNPAEVGPPDPMQDILNQLIAGGSPGVSAPNLASYLKPYDDAEASARGYYDKAKPAISGMYSDLQGQIANRQLMQQEAAKQAAVVQGQDAAKSIGTVQGDSQMAVDALKAQFGDQLAGSTAAGAEAQLAGNVGAMQSQANNQAQYQHNLAQAADTSSTERQGEANVARDAALSNADNNLGSLLNQIGLGKAQATAQFNNDSAQAAAQNASNAREDLKFKYGILQDQKNQELEQVTAQQKLMDSAMITPKERLQRYSESIRNQAPATYDTFEAVTNGASSAADAMRNLSDHWDELSQGAADNGTELDRRRIEQLVREWYDERKSVVDPEKKQLLGGGAQ